MPLRRYAALGTVTAFVLLAVVGATLLTTNGPAQATTEGDEPATPLTDDPRGAVIGRVRDWDGRPIADASVSLPAYGIDGRTDADGSYRFYSVPVGRVVVRVEAPGAHPSARMLHVSEGVVHQLNFRVSTPASPAPDVTLERHDGVLECRAVALGAALRCEDGNEHVVNLTRSAMGVVVELAWQDVEEGALNLTVGEDGARDPISGRLARPWSAAEGGSVLRAAFVPPSDADSFTSVVTYPSERLGAPAKVPYVLWVTVFHNREPPHGYSVFHG